MYPVSYSAQIATEGRSRLSIFFRYFAAIPILLVASIMGIVGYIAAVIAWFAIVFTGRYPQGIYDFNAKVVRILARANSYIYLATDQYPPFNGDEDPNYPVQVGIAPPLESYSRVKTLFRAIIGIPVLLLAYVWNLIISVISLIAWFTGVFAAKVPEGLVGPLAQGLAYSTRANAYYIFLLTEDYPPFSDEAAGTPIAQIAPTEAPVVQPPQQ